MDKLLVGRPPQPVAGGVYGKGELTFPMALPQFACSFCRAKEGAQGKGGLMCDERSYLQFSHICSVKGRVTHTTADRILDDEGGSRNSHYQDRASESQGRAVGAFTHGGKPRLQVMVSGM